MILFIDISNQIIEDENAFCFYNSINGKIEEFWGQTVFGSAEDFIEFTKGNFEYAEYNHNYTQSLLERKEAMLKRCISQIPKSFYNKPELTLFDI